MSTDLRNMQSKTGGTDSEIEKLKKTLEDEKLKKIQVRCVFGMMWILALKSVYEMS